MKNGDFPASHDNFLGGGTHTAIFLCHAGGFVLLTAGPTNQPQHRGKPPPPPNLPV